MQGGSGLNLLLSSTVRMNLYSTYVSHTPLSELEPLVKKDPPLLGAAYRLGFLSVLSRNMLLEGKLERPGWGVECVKANKG